MPRTVSIAVLRRPPFRHHGRKVIAAFCSYELASLVPKSPLPTISEMVRRRPVVGLMLLALLSHHWFLELEEPQLVLVTSTPTGT